MGSEWQKQAVCASVEPELFYPAPQEHVRRRQAKAVCKSCPVVNECLQWALESGQDHGVWGGLSEDERRTLKRRNARARIRTA